MNTGNCQTADQLTEECSPVKMTLFTTGTVMVSDSVRGAAAKSDAGYFEEEFITILGNVRRKLIEIAKLPSSKYTTVLMQGSGTYSVESVLNSTSTRNKKLLILACGLYGQRMELICVPSRIPYQIINFPEHEPIQLNDEILSMLATPDSEFDSVAIVHVETPSGVVNPIHEIGMRIKEQNPSIQYIVDAMSSFGGIETDYSTVDFLISSPSKSMQGLPGLGFVICDKKKLMNCKGNSSSLCLDLYEQWIWLESTGRFRFTPPTHVILAFNQAIQELESEGGVVARFQRFKAYKSIILKGMAKMGFRRFVADAYDGPFSTTFYSPRHKNFDFQQFCDRLSDKGQCLCKQKSTTANCFRVGNIGHLFPSDLKLFLVCVEQVLVEMKITIPVSY